MIVIGIDPGKSGALCAMEDGAIIDLIDMPVDTEGFDRWAVRFLAPRFFLEKVGGLPGQSAPRAFAFGEHVGWLKATIRRFGPMVPVTPQRWKADLAVPRDKKLAIARATELLPTEAHRWPLAKHDGRAEAAMIALWGTMYG